MNTETQASKGHPKGLYVLFVTEMWERFSYYGMRALFVLFMTKALLFDKSLGSQIYGSYTGLVYLTPLIGGYMADRYWGNRKSIIVGGVLMAIGQFFMFLSGSFYQEVGFASIMMYTGLGFLIFGNGFFKPNISTMVGQLYPQGDKRVDSAFTIFYMGINLGAFIAPLLCGFLGDTGRPEDFRWGFLAACVGMVLSLILFIWLKNKYIVTPEGEQIGVAPNKARNTPEIDTTAEVSASFSTGTMVTSLDVSYSH
jgi:POT family proton-dependent oligopeptide transporter